MPAASERILISASVCYSSGRAECRQCRLQTKQFLISSEYELFHGKYVKTKTSPNGQRTVLEERTAKRPENVMPFTHYSWRRHNRSQYSKRKSCSPTWNVVRKFVDSGYFNGNSSYYMVP